MKNILILAVVVLAGCAGSMQQQASVERMYVINCGENHVKDMARWSSADAGKSVVFLNHCYLIKHARGWMLWDTGNPDRLAAMPNGLTNPAIGLTAYMRKPLADSLKEIGVAPAAIQHFALSHFHNDHSGNANLFGASTLYMQAAEYDAVFGADPKKYNVPVANFEQLRAARAVKLNGDHDVFGDGSVMILSAPGHTIGHQVLFVRLAKTGPVILSGDMTHYFGNWNAKRVPSMNLSAEQSVASMQKVERVMQQTGAKLWINHDPEQGKTIPKAPAFVN